MDERQFNAFMTRLAEMLQGVRQYVGARYVPNFLDDPWNDTTQYEALDVVDNGMGTSYIAKKPVPAGTPLSNREFWFVYGSTSGAIIHLQNQIDAIVNTIIPGINSEIETLSNFCIYNKRGIIFITDSFGTYDISGDTMMDLAARYMGVTNYDAQAVNGAGFVAGTQTFKDILDSITPPSWTVTDIVVLGGTNDHNISAADITTAMASFVADAKTLYPNAKIWFGCTGGPSYKTSSVNGPLQTINNIYPAWLNCMSVGAHPLDNLISALHGNVNKRSDNTHPDNNGLLLLAKSIAECLTTGRCHNNYLVVNDTDNTTVENSGQLYTSTIFQNINDENVVIGSTGPTSIGYPTPITITGNTNIHLLTFDKFIAAPNLAYHTPTEVNFVVGGTAHLQDADIFMDSNRLFLRTYLGTVANVERIQFTLPQIILPSMRC